MNVNKIELDIDQVSELVRNNLIDDYHMMVEYINGPIPFYEKVDLADNIKFRDALKVILEYYMIPSEYKEIFPE